MLQRGPRLSSILGAQDPFPQDPLLSVFSSLPAVFPFQEPTTWGLKLVGVNPFWHQVETECLKKD